MAFVPGLAAVAAMQQRRLRSPSELPTANHRRLHLIGPMGVVTLALAFQVFVSYDIIFSPLFFGCSILSGVFLGLLIRASIKNAGLWHCLALAVLFCSAAVVHINALSLSKASVLDRGTVIKKYTARRGMVRMLVIQGGDHQETRVHVDEQTFRSHGLGAQVCVFVRFGTLGIGIRNFGPCQDGA